jgi:peroxiredoxin
MQRASWRLANHREWQMKWVAMLGWLLIISATAVAQSGAERAAGMGATLVGKPAPTLRLRNLSGDVIDVADYRGKQAVYLKFWATWCQPCIAQMPHFQRAFESAGPGLAVIAINAGFNDTPAAIRQFQHQHHITMPMTIDDGSAAAALNLRVTPLHVLIDRAGIVRFVGHLADARLDDALRSIQGAAVNGTAGAVTGASIPIKYNIKYKIGNRIAPLQLQPLDAAQAVQLPSAGRPSVLVFISTWCESYLAETRPQMSAQCRRSREQLSALPSELIARAQWTWIASGIWTDASELREYRDQQHIATPMLLDSSGALFNTFDVRQVPAILVIDGQGMLRQRLRGDEPDLVQQLQRALTAGQRQ